jgi:rhodanese-related sulfurtransferase
VPTRLEEIPKIMTKMFAAHRTWILAAVLAAPMVVLALSGNAHAQSSGSSGSSGSSSGSGDASAAAGGDAPGGGDAGSASVAGAVTASAVEIGGMMGDTGARVVIIDVRPRAAFAKGHLRNAKNLQVRYSDVLREHVFDKSALGADKSAQIVIYGAGDRDPAAAAVVRKALSEGYSNVIWMRGGFADWIAARLPASES